MSIGTMLLRRGPGITALCALCGLGLLLVLLQPPRLVQAAAPAATGQTAAAAAVCDGVGAIPHVECTALVHLYDTANGPGWDVNTNWRTVAPGVTPCDWFGVQCNGGHVTSLLLPSNRLSGTLPAAIGALGQLMRLDLRDNLLGGALPGGLCELVDTAAGNANLAYNRFHAANSRVRACAMALDPDGGATQTIAPRDVTVSAIATDSLTLTWRPISYTADGGGYQVLTAPQPAGPYTLHGQTPDKSANEYVIDGLTPGTTYFVAVRTFTPSHANQENDLTSESAGVAATTAYDGDPVLLMVYFPADNDLSPYVPFVVERIRRGTLVNPNVQVTMLTDRLGTDNTRFLVIANGTITVTNRVQNVWSKSELDTTDPDVLAWFLQESRDHFPASKTIVSLMGHGIGMMPEFGWIVGEAPGGEPIVQPGIPALPRGIEATPGDVTDRGGYLSTIDFGRALAAATNHGADPFDVLFFDQCFQGSLDVLYEVRDYAEVLIASPNYAWLSAPYHQYVTVMAPAATSEAIAQAIVRLYFLSLNSAHPNVILWLKTTDIAPIAAAVNNLATALQAAVAAGRRADIYAASVAALYVDTTQCGPDQFDLGQPDELMGAGSFARSLRPHFPQNDPQGVRAAAAALLAALGAVAAAERVGVPYIAPDEFWDYRDSVTLLAPLQPDAPANVAWRASIYNTGGPMTAVWSPAPTQTVQVTGTFALAQDGQWDDFIAAWYTSPLTPTIGEWCQYSPPALVTSEVTETLALALDPNPTTLELSWTPTAADEADAYWVLTRGVDDERWVVLATVPVDQTSYAADLPAPGETAVFAVAAQDPLGVTLAESNEAAYTTPAAERALYLPLLDN